MYDKPMTNFLILLYKKEHSRLDYAQKTFYLTKQPLDNYNDTTNRKRFQVLWGHLFHTSFKYSYQHLVVINRQY